MQAVVFREFGGPEVLQVAQLPDPVPGPHEVVVKVAAAVAHATAEQQQSGIENRSERPAFVLGISRRRRGLCRKRREQRYHFARQYQQHHLDSEPHGLERFEFGSDSR